MTIPLQTRVDRASLYIQGNLSLTNLKGPKILFFKAGILLLLGLFATKVAADYGFTCPPRFMSVCWFVVCWDRRKLQFLSRAQSDWAET
jgi:hypothetical protein